MQPSTSNDPALFEVPVLGTYNAITGLDPSDLVSVTDIPNVISIYTLQGYVATYTADPDMTFVAAVTLDQNISKAYLQTFTPPPNKTVQFNDGIFVFTMKGGVWGPSGRIVTLRNDDPAVPNHYYAYGSTPDNANPNWHDFSYDNTTGAEFVSNKILLHFVYGQRGYNA